jgi:cysteine-rich repeat protein
MLLSSGEITPPCGVPASGYLTCPPSSAAPVPGITAEDLDVSVKTTTDGLGPGEKCSILSTSSDTPDVNGDYPDAGTVNAEILLERGGPQFPTGGCVVTVQAAGSDGVSVSARGSQTIFVTPTEIDTSATVMVPDIAVRQSKAVAGLDKDCNKWVKKQIRLRRSCNWKLLRRGAPIAPKCRDAGPEPPSCDPGDHVAAMLALAWGANDQQTAPGVALAIDDFSAIRDQAVCQNRLGRAAKNYAIKRIRLVLKRCVESGLDSPDCREDQSRDTKRKLDQIDRCPKEQMTDGATGITVPDAGAPCDVCTVPGVDGVDAKCLKSCFQAVLDEFTDGVVGDLPVCGNGILQPGEFCDDGNTTDGDCCSSTCTVEPPGSQTCGDGICEVTVPECSAGVPVPCVPGSPGIEGPVGNPTCTDLLDNDCDGAMDGADTDCQ